MFSHEPRCIYRRNQLSDVICQLRFPEIVQIQQQHPDAFLQQIRQEFPTFSLRKDMPAPSNGSSTENMSTSSMRTSGVNAVPSEVSAVKT